MASQDTEVMQSITQMVNPKTGTNYTVLEAQRLMRAAMQRRVKESRRLSAWRASRKVG